jgi:hypothetical protein
MLIDVNDQSMPDMLNLFYERSAIYPITKIDKNSSRGIAPTLSGLPRITSRQRPLRANKRTCVDIPGRRKALAGRNPRGHLRDRAMPCAAGRQ